MNLSEYKLAFAIGATVLASLIFTGPIPSVRADDDWEDRQEDYEEWLEDQREEAEERWEDREEAIEEWREDRGRSAHHLEVREHADGGEDEQLVNLHESQQDHARDRLQHGHSVAAIQVQRHRPLADLFVHQREYVGAGADR